MCNLTVTGGGSPWYSEGYGRINAETLETLIPSAQNYIMFILIFI
jgi:hypothetical protein